MTYVVALKKVKSRGTKKQVRRSFKISWSQVQLDVLEEALGRRESVYWLRCILPRGERYKRKGGWVAEMEAMSSPRRMRDTGAYNRPTGDNLQKAVVGEGDAEAAR